MTAVNWKQRAKELAKEGYVTGAWEGLLRTSLTRSRPELVKELGADLPHYLKVRAVGARQLQDRLIDQGTPPDQARELALADLLGTSDD